MHTSTDATVDGRSVGGAINIGGENCIRKWKSMKKRRIPRRALRAIRSPLADIHCLLRL